jgi:hypothetical protein
MARVRRSDAPKGTNSIVGQTGEDGIAVVKPVGDNGDYQSNCYVTADRNDETVEGAEVERNKIFLRCAVSLTVQSRVLLRGNSF